MKIVTSSRMVALGLAGLALSSPSVHAAVDCQPLSDWQNGNTYTKGDQVKTDNTAYEARWWTQADPATQSGEWKAWKILGQCAGSVNQAPTATLTVSPSGPIEVGDTLTFTLAGTDTDGTVTSFALSQGDTLLYEGAEATAIRWQAEQTGRFTFTLTVTDDKGATDIQTLQQVVGDDQTGGDEYTCRPAGLYTTPDVEVPYCSVYDENGLEDMGADHPRRVIGYFTSWRNGANGQPAYLVSDIPWNKITHINYAFAHINADNQLSIGDPNAPDNPATQMTWPGVAGAEMDPTLPYKGHFNLLNKYKKQHPDVKTLISVGGWAETGGYFDENGERVDSGGFYTMTTNADGSVNQAGIKAFTDSAVAFLRQYGFDGLDIDYEYPSSMKDSGHPDDFEYSNLRRAHLNKSYQVLMKSLREALDKASAQDDKHYMLTIAAPSSGYLLRGMETFQTTQYLDYVNIMSYDLHGAWNDHVGHQAPLYDTGEDSELKQWNVYQTPEFEGIGYLNTDWAATYFMGGMSPGRINIGIPYYTRGFKDVQGGDKGLWGRAPLPNQSECPAGTGVGEKNKCGNGAVGIDNLWHDVDELGNEVPAGSNPLWHVKNLLDGKLPAYAAEYGLDPEQDPSDRLTGNYQAYYDDIAKAPWVWNEEKRVFLSMEDETSMAEKVDYVVNKGLGGMMFWELAGDYRYDDQRQAYFMGDTLTSLAYQTFKQAGSDYSLQRGDANFQVPSEQVDVTLDALNFPVGDDNYPIRPTFRFTNHSDLDLSGATISFDVPVSTSAIFKSDWNAQKKLRMEVVRDSSNASGNNIGGFDATHHRFAITLINEWGGIEQSFKPGETLDAQVMYYMPITNPTNITIEKDGQRYAVKQEYPSLPPALPGSTSQSGGESQCPGVDIASLSTYPNWPNGVNHASGGDQLIYQEAVWEAKWWTQAAPGGQAWRQVCSL